MLMSVTDNDVGSIMAVQAQSLPSNGELNMTGLRTFSYTPRPGFVGTDTFSYQAKDATQAASNPATVLLKVTPDGASQEESDDGDGREFRKGKNSDQRDRYDDDDDDDASCYRDGDRKHKKHGNKDWDDDDGGVLRNFDDSGQDGTAREIGTAEARVTGTTMTRTATTERTTASVMTTTTMMTTTTGSTRSTGTGIPTGTTRTGTTTTVMT